MTVSGSTSSNASITASEVVSGTITVNEQTTTTTTTTTTNSNIYFENGTCKCPNATVGDTAVINGTTYTAVNNSTIAAQIASGNVNLCTTLVTSMRELFRDDDSFNADISFWDTSNVTNMYGMFASTPFNQDIGGWDTSNVTDMGAMFFVNPFNQNIGNWNTSNVTIMRYMFNGATDFNQNIGNWNTSNVTTMLSMFHGATDFNQDIGNWNVSSVTNMEQMFYQATAFNQDLTGWCVTNFSSEPQDFATNGSALSNANKPVWGTCPD